MMLSWLFSDPLPTGADAPDFTLLDEAGNSVALASFRGVSNVVLVFYPGDETPGCIRQLCQFRDRWSEAQSKDAVVFGVNPQSAGSHERFRNKRAFPFPLLVDKGQKVGALYHANGLIVKRTVYLIGKSGKIRFASRDAPAPDIVLAAAE
jgi:peroxiredoxin Q/BCP